MNKSGIDNRDLVLAKKVEGDCNNENVVVVVNGLGAIKKLRYIKEGEDLVPILFPDSTDSHYQPIILHSEDQIQICGKVEQVFKTSAMEDND
jgi:phage repressor protein C with HTH and peptisase S24 domain